MRQLPPSKHQLSSSPVLGPGRTEEDEETPERGPHRVAFESARLRLARISQGTHAARESCFRLVTQVVADALGVDRVGIWMFEDDARLLVCKTQFVHQSRSYESGQVLQMSRFPSYQAALGERRALVANDARTSPITRELAAGYLVPAGILSMLDAPIIRDGEVAGVVCLEHGTRRQWSQVEIDFSGSAGDLTSLLLEQADRAELASALKMQTELRLEQDKMEALGRMARSIAHDINNLLTVVLSAGEDAQASATRSPPCPCCARSAETLFATAEVGQRMVRQLLDLGRRDAPQSQVIDARSVLTGLMPALRSLVGARIKIALHVSSGSAWVKMQQTELEQVVLNLVVNARDALQTHARDARIDVVLRDPEPDDELPPDWLVLELSDNGVGMDAETRVHVFEPYFSTKARGNGLGLSIVYGIVTRAGGNVHLASLVGEGTTFQIDLPREPSRS